jgi:DNA-binding NarL/FixJ family response regulator
VKRNGRWRENDARKPRVCVVESHAGEAPYERLDECDIEVMAVLPRLGDADQSSRNFDLIVIGCNELLLRTSSFQRRVAHLAQQARVVGVAPRPTPNLAAHAARIGFHGFVAREVEPEAFDRAVRAVMSGELAFPRSTMSAVIQLIRRAYGRRPKPDAEVELTPRQRQVVVLMAQGANDREIADLLRISPSTVHKHVQNARRRTNTRTRSHLAAALGQPT